MDGDEALTGRISGPKRKGHDRSRLTSRCTRRPRADGERGRG